MKTLIDGTQIKIINTYKNTSKNCNNEGVYYNLLFIELCSGKRKIICQSELVI